VDEWPRSKHSIGSITGAKIINNGPKVPLDIIQQIANNMDQHSALGRGPNVVDGLNIVSDGVSDIGPNPKLIDININTEMQKLSDNGYKILRKNKEIWDESSIDDQK
jgi:hypothetical protein